MSECFEEIKALGETVKSLKEEIEVLKQNVGGYNAG